MTDPKDSALRRAVRITALVLIVIGTVWALTLIITGGIDVRIGGRLITSHEPLRPLAAAAVGLILLVIAEGPQRAYGTMRRVTTFVNPTALAGLLSAATLFVGLIYASTAATGADSYGYVSQAEMWIAGDLHVDQRFAAEVPWPNAKWTFSPLGYRPLDTDGDWRIVPTYSAGLPLLMAGTKLVFGQCAIFWIVPISGALLVFATYGIGQRLGSPTTAVVGAWLTATSPTVLFMLMVPMTDVPVAAAWACAFYLLLGSSATAAVGSGLLAAVAITIRPNLAFLAGVMGLWYVVRLVVDGGRTGRGRVIAQAVLFALSVVPGVVTVAAVNRALYGSALTSGYGSIGGIFGWSHVWPNIRHYFAWLAESQTPLALFGFVALAVPLRVFWPGVRHRAVFVVIGLFVLSLWASYWLYLEFDVWWYLRFLLPSWPFIMLGLGALATPAFRSEKPVVVLLTVGAMLALGVAGVRKAQQGFAFDMWHGERRYVSAALNTRDMTPPGSVVLTMQHSGALRYYGGRMTMRYDQLAPDWLDRAVAFMAERGVQTYLLVEDWELEEFRKRFAGQQTIGRLADPPLVILGGDSTTRLFDLSGGGVATAGQRRVDETPHQLRCVPPAPPPTLVFR